MQRAKPVAKRKKQRKRLFQAPDHIRYKHFAAPLSPELRASHGTRTLPVRSGDTVRIMRGDHKGFEGKITRIDRGKYRIHVEGLTRDKVDGTTIFVPVHPSKAMIISLSLEDKWRRQILERKKRVPEAALKTEEKTPTEEPTKKEEEKAPKTKRKRRKKKAVKKRVESEVEGEAGKPRQSTKTEKRKTVAKRGESAKKKMRTRRTDKTKGGK